jgi:hypothetical protein
MILSPGSRRFVGLSIIAINKLTKAAMLSTGMRSSLAGEKAAKCDKTRARTWALA